MIILSMFWTHMNKLIVNQFLSVFGTSVPRPVFPEGPDPSLRGSRYRPLTQRYGYLNTRCQWFLGIYIYIIIWVDSVSRLWTVKLWTAHFCPTKSQLFKCSCLCPQGHRAERPLSVQHWWFQMVSIHPYPALKIHIYIPTEPYTHFFLGWKINRYLFLIAPKNRYLFLKKPIYFLIPLILRIFKDNMEDLCGYRFSRHLLQFRGTHQRTFNRWSPLAQSGAPLGGFQHDDRFKIHMVILIPEINIFIQCHHWHKLSTYVHTHLLPKFMRFFPFSSMLMMRADQHLPWWRWRRPGSHFSPLTGWRVADGGTIEYT